jgi:hypothetical protein
MENEIDVTVDIKDVVDELQRRFPKELTIAIQAVQLRQLQNGENTDEPEVPQESE